MIVAGIMSGTSADGIDVALVRLLGGGINTRLHLLAHEHRNYPAAVRQAVLDAMNADSARVADLARLNTLLGELYADALEHTLKKHRGYNPELVGCHGQTLYHQGSAESFLGRKIATTWQTGESAAIAARLGLPVISDFRPADMAAGGKGAPLVPLLDYVFYRHSRRIRVLQNLGGIANFSIIPAGGSPEDVIAFDTGPGNMVMDGCAQILFGKPYDQKGQLAAGGKIIASALQRALEHPFFHRRPPKTAGREEFGAEFVARFLGWCGRKARKHDVIATATALTARSIGIALGGSLRELQSSRPSKKPKRVAHDYIVSGGGARNKTLLKMLRTEVDPLGFRLHTSDQLGLPAEAKEATAFALLAYATWHRKPGNLPSATGASRPAILGKVTYV
jgi:anhydro-N-acetylmuramic acid kinase